MFDLDRSPISRIALLTALVSTAAACGGSMRAAESRSPSKSSAYGPSPASYSGGSGTAAADSAGGAAYESAPSTGYAPAPAAAPAAPGGTYAPSPTPSPAAKSASPPPATATAPVTITGKGTITVLPGGGGGTPYTQDSPTGGVLTAAIWDDNAVRDKFLSFLDRYPTYRSEWNLDLSRRVTIRVEDSNGVAVGDAPLALRTPAGGIINLRTHGDGTAVFFPTSTSGVQYVQQQQSTGMFGVAAQVGVLRTETTFHVPTTDTTWTVKLPGIPARAKDPALDVAFVVDCTGSMGDEIAYLQAELMGVVKRVKTEHAMRRVRLGLVLYRDRGDDFVTRSYPFTEDLGTFLNQLKTAQAQGGGDMPESVNAALADTVQKLSWAGDETGRLAILVADAPPHYYADEQYTYKNAIVDLSARGVKLITLGASGIDKTTEYLFRQMSAYTGGRYIFLTDDSGVGDSHLVPDITGYQVEHLDRILVRAIGDEARAFKR